MQERYSQGSLYLRRTSCPCLSSWLKWC